MSFKLAAPGARFKKRENIAPDSELSSYKRTSFILSNTFTDFILAFLQACCEHALITTMEHSTVSKLDFIRNE